MIITKRQQRSITLNTDSGFNTVQHIPAAVSSQQVVCLWICS